MLVSKETALRTEAGGRACYLCSAGCRRTFEAPEAELRSLKRRVPVALAGVLVLAILRAAVFLGLAGGATVLTWAPIQSQPWLTWGVRKIRQNLFWAFAYDTAAIPVVAAVFLSPIIAPAAMALASLSVISSSPSLKRLRLERAP